ncbi:MAG: DoxX family membrane protein [Sphingomonadales bacterium]|nr:DoxX family membrane protein [Sphingomonadales bacterium]
MTVSTLIARLFLGAFLVFNGINLWFPFLPVQKPNDQAALDLMHGLVVSGLFEFVKIVEIATGLMLIFNRFVPLGLALMLPLTVVIAWVDFVLIRSANSVVFGLLLVVPHLFLLLAYLRYYLPTAAIRAQPALPTGDDVAKALAGVR